MTYVTDVADVIDLESVVAVLEVGSYDVNGSVRPLFAGPSYVGVDMRAGPGVDRVVNANSLPFPDATFDVVISTEMLEHDTRPWRSVAEMARVLRDGGTLILTARGYDERGCYEIHDSPGDYWRFTVKGFAEMVADAGLTVLDARKDPTDPGVFLTARKGE